MSTPKSSAKKNFGKINPKTHKTIFTALPYWGGDFRSGTCETADGKPNRIKPVVSP